MKRKQQSRACRKNFRPRKFWVLIVLEGMLGIMETFYYELFLTDSFNCEFIFLTRCRIFVVNFKVSFFR